MRELGFCAPVVDAAMTPVPPGEVGIAIRILLVIVAATVVPAILFALMATWVFPPVSGGSRRPGSPR